MRIGWLWSGLTRCGRDREATRLLDSRDMHIKPLAWEKLSLSAAVLRWRSAGRRLYVEFVLWSEGKSERFYSVIDRTNAVYLCGVESVMAGLGRCSFFVTEACSGRRLGHAAQ